MANNHISATRKHRLVCSSSLGFAVLFYFLLVLNFPPVIRHHKPQPAVHCHTKASPMFFFQPFPSWDALIHSAPLNFFYFTTPLNCRPFSDPLLLWFAAHWIRGITATVQSRRVPSDQCSCWHVRGANSYNMCLFDYLACSSHSSNELVQSTDCWGIVQCVLLLQKWNWWTSKVLTANKWQNVKSCRKSPLLSTSTCITIILSIQDKLLS